ncbi:unnamed protein product [Microthlaspi erraticum]|uniref:Uncharacterized protein n=2 Tax=Microthlaspi erraticum TaxID=1685480 RepID=A0A6D2I4W9_9BRAS|nr:unnamed protein product [Microthlaspi erraticum]
MQVSKSRRSFYLQVLVLAARRTKLRKFGRARRSSRRPKVTILIWKDRYLSHASRRSGMKPFGSTMRPRLIFYRDMSGKRVNEAHGGFGVSNGPSSSAKGLDRKRRGLANVWSFPWYNVGPYTTWRRRLGSWETFLFRHEENPTRLRPYIHVFSR